jgi:2,4-dienoyl-CoA reductase (NADPH2)
VLPVAATIGHNVTLYEKAASIGGQFNMAKRIPGKEEFYETIRYFDWQLNKLEKEGKLKMKLGSEISNEDMVNDQSVDRWIVATGVDARTPSIPGINGPNVMSYIDVLQKKIIPGKRVAIIGAGGIGFDVAEYLLHHNDSSEDTTSADKAKIDHFLAEWGVDGKNESRGGLLQNPASISGLSGRQITMLQRKKGKLGRGLGKTTGWIHRATLSKSNAVEMLDEVAYDKVDENGHLHITIKKGDSNEEKRVLEVDSIVTCAGQISKKQLEEEASAHSNLSSKVYPIGGAYEAGELDAKRAIDMGTRLALKIRDHSVIPGNHTFQSRTSAEEKLFKFMMKLR